jgi:hypothetical protein
LSAIPLAILHTILLSIPLPITLAILPILVPIILRILASCVTRQLPFAMREGTKAHPCKG